MLIAAAWMVGAALVLAPAGIPPIKLSDTQSILLATAAQDDSGSLYPLPETITDKAGATKSIAALVKHALAEQRETPTQQRWHASMATFATASSPPPRV